jgi:hypothetical protein
VCLRPNKPVEESLFNINISGATSDENLNKLAQTGYMVPGAYLFPANKSRNQNLFSIEERHLPMSTAVHPRTKLSTWSIGPARSSVPFKVRQMMISNVHGEFRTLRGSLKLNAAEITQLEIDIAKSQA